VLCECDRDGCIAQIEVPSAVHADVCASPGRFIVLPGHELGSEAVVAAAPTYSVVAHSAAPVAVTQGEAVSEPTEAARTFVVAPHSP